MINFLSLCFILVTSPVTGACSSSFSPHHHHHHEVAVKDGHRVVIEFQEGSQGKTQVSISQPDDSGVFNKLKNMFEKTKGFQDRATEVIDNAVKKAGGKAIGVIEKATTEVGKTMGITEGTVKDSVVKLEEWDLVDSPKRIGEDIGHNASEKLEQGVEEVKETVENVIETNPKTVINYVLSIVSSWRSVMGWCHLLGFSTAYGMGMWVTFFSWGVMLGKCLTKEQSVTVSNIMNIVYLKAMGYCVGGAFLGFVVSQGTRVGLFNKMEMFQEFNLVSALVMLLINLFFLEPRATKFIAQSMKGSSEAKSVAAEKLKKINAYISTLNVWTMVVLTWHLAYIGQLLRARP